MRIGSIDLQNLRGVADKAVGLGKEFVGTVVGNERIIEAGESQQEAASERLKAVRQEAKAQSREAEAEGQQRRQKVAQTAKERG